MRRSSTTFLAEFGNFHSGFQATKNGRHRSRVATGEIDDDIAMAGGLKVDIDKVFAAAD